jgi:hypothetical protein
MLMAWDPAGALLDAFEQARGLLRLRRCRSYQGFVKARARAGVALVARLRAHLAGLLRTVPDGWTILGWIVFAVDGSRFDAPRTKVNLADMGVGGKGKSHPQMLATVLVHLGLGVLWNWRIGRAGASERGHLRRLAASVPRGALLVGDAGFIGYDGLRSVVAGGREFLVRLAGNTELVVGLLERSDVAALWPRKRNASLPLLIRVVRLRDAKGSQIVLGTSVMDPARLTDEQAGVFYRLRWGVEVTYRSLKETMGRRKMLSASPRRARLELHWTMLAYMMLGVLATRRLAPGHDRARWSVALALRAVRRAAMARNKTRADAALGGLRHAVIGNNARKNKAAYNWPRKKKQRPPGSPRLRTASEVERQRYQGLAHAAA